MADAEARERAHGVDDLTHYMQATARLKARVAALEQWAEDLVEALRWIREQASGPSDYVYAHSLQARIDAVLSARPTEDTPEPREGIVTVRDHTGRYLGCMGRERWELLLAEDSARPTEETAG